MATDFSKYSNYRDNAGVSSVVFGAKSAILEVELNEMQEIQKTFMRRAIGGVMGDGISNINAMSYGGGTFRIDKGCIILVAGYPIKCTGLTISAPAGSNIYVQVWEDVVNYSEILNEEGNQQSTTAISNYFRDSRALNETTRRKVLKYTLATAVNNARHNLLIAKINERGTLVKIAKEINYHSLYDKVTNLEIQTGISLGKGIIGIEVDLENDTIRRIGDNESWSAGSDYTNNSIIYGTRSRCAVDSSGKIQGFLNSNTGKYGTNITDEQPGGASSGALQFMVQQRAFYYKRIPIKVEKQNGIDGYHMTKWIDLISPNPAPGFKIHPAFVAGDREYSYYLIGENNGSICWILDDDYVYEDNDGNWESIMAGYKPMLSSVSLVKPMSGMNRQLMPSSIADMCTLRGANWCNEDIAIASAEQMLFAIEYATFNVQNTGLGLGATQLASLPAQDNNAVENPVNSTLGNGSGIIPVLYNAGNGTTYTVNVPVYRGVKNPFGNINTLIDGIIMQNNKLYWENDADMTPDVAHYTECGFGSSINIGGYISAFGYSEECDFMYIPTRSSGDSNKPVGDLVSNTDAVSTQMNYLVLGGNYGDGLGAGLFCTRFKANNHITGDIGTHSDICTRLCWKYGRSY